MPHIQQIKISSFWESYYNIDWALDPQVNILFGFNGSGKTTILNAINQILFYRKPLPMGYWSESKPIENICIIFNNQNTITLDYKKKLYTSSSKRTDFLYQIITTFDRTIVSNDSNTSLLFQELQKLVYGDGTSTAHHFEKYRSQRLDLLDEDKIEEAIEIQDNIQLFYQIVNDFFAVSGKKIKFKEQKMFFENGDKKIELEQLSAGEKQLLIILLNVLLQDKKDYILLMDEPEISLHITWQQMLIEKILLLNPNCQLIIATHSPSVFGKGWRDKIVRMEELLKVSK